MRRRYLWVGKNVWMNKGLLEYFSWGVITHSTEGIFLSLGIPPTTMGVSS